MGGLGPLDRPTTLGKIAGELDATCPSNVMQKMAALAGGEFHEMKGVGHYGWGERPDEYHARVLDFLQRRLPG